MLEALHPRLRALLQAEGWDSLTPIQDAAWVPLAARKHALLLAPTGHGKTEAALLPVLHQMLTERDRLVAARGIAARAASGTASRTAPGTASRTARGTAATPPATFGTPATAASRSARATARGPATSSAAVGPAAGASADGPAWPPGFKLLYITPLRALNRDLLRRLEGWCAELGFTIGVRHGDTSQAQRTRQARSPPDILITTPETLQLLLYGDTLRRHLATVRFVVIDEVHDLAQSERGAQLVVALERLEEVVGQPKRLLHAPARDRTCPTRTHARAGGGFQRIGLSATVADDAVTARFLAGRGREAEIVRAGGEKEHHLQVVHPQITPQDEEVASRLSTPVAAAAQLRVVRQIVAKMERVIVFHNTRDGAEMMTSRSALLDDEEGQPSLMGLHHGSLSAEHRVDVETRFRDGELRGLVATSSLELGIDVGAIDHVVQVQSPRSVARLVQRLGRAGHRIGAVSAGTLVSAGPEDHLECLAVADMARAGRLEPLRIRDSPLVVLANQIIALSNEYAALDPGWCWQVVTRAAPFAELDEGLFQACCDTLLDVKTLFEAGQAPGRIARSGRARRHFLQNVSLIPDETRYRVVDEAAKRSIGTVDDAYVAAAMQPGEQFVMAGRSWRVLEVDVEGRRVRVGPSRELGAIPHWSGQQLPVSFALAQQVAHMRGRIAATLQGSQGAHEGGSSDGLGAGADLGDANRLGRPAEEGDEAPGGRVRVARANGDPRDRVVEREAAAASDLAPSEEAPATPPIQAHLDAGLRVPTDRVVTLDSGRAGIVACVALGTRGNETLGRLTAALLHQRTGVPVGMQSDAYRIHLQVPASVGPADVEATWRAMDPETLDLLLGMVLRDQPVLRHHLVHVAKHFGAVPGQLDPNRFTRATMDALWERLALQEETLSRLLHDRFDVEAVATFLHELADGEVELVHQGMGPLSRLASDEVRGHFAPRSDAQLVDAVRRRIEDSDVLMVCTQCRSRLEKKVADIPRQVRCRRCGSNAVACLRPWDEERLELLGKQTLTASQKKERARIVRHAQIMAGFGGVAARCLVARGVGPDTAARILQKISDPASPVFWREILQAELEYARTQAFWR